MNWFCCKYFYTLGCNLSCGCLDLNLLALQDGTHTIEFSYQNSPIIHRIDITDVEIGDSLVVPKDFNPNSYIWLKILQPDGTYLESEFLDELGDPILDEDTLLPITTTCYTTKIYPERKHYEVSIDDSCEKCDIAKGYASSYLTFYDERNKDIQFIKIGNNLINLNHFDGVIQTENLTATQVHTAIADYFDNTTNAALQQLIKDYSISITTFPDKIRIRTKSVVNGSSLCDTRIQFLGDGLFPININANEFQCCFEQDELDERCQYSNTNAIFYFDFQVFPILSDLYIVFNNDNPANSAEVLTFLEFADTAEFEDSIANFNDAYSDYFIKRTGYSEFALYTNKWKCDDQIQVYHRNDDLLYYDITETMFGSTDIEANCCDSCDYTDFVTFKFIPNISLGESEVINISTNETLFTLPAFDIADIPQFLVDITALTTYPASVVDGAVTISVPTSELPGHVCGQEFDIRIDNSFDNAMLYPNKQIMECCFSS